ncbi:helix-turn-helix transcriptional regulator [Gordonia sp. X0973]|uniref:helix-turn-helix transcriptional regulator n=1 Tax=Gordonia sp. X0973 TaxID=2742602 RepID=UPI0013EB24D4|nr:helix-turn-helix transcriptional regulator [Gordonia sp. X0973]QKT08031.1 helix-turn-helix transcriptional regulator [Gordonia sp. X0973]
MWDMNREIGRKVREARERKSLSRNAFADELKERADMGIEAKTIVRIEAGERALKVEELPAFAQVLGVSVLELLPFDDVDKDTDLALAEASVVAMGREADALLAAWSKYETARQEARSAMRAVGRSPVPFKQEALEGIERRLDGVEQKVGGALGNRYESDEGNEAWMQRRRGARK